MNVDLKMSVEYSDGIILYVDKGGLKLASEIWYQR